MTEPITVRIKGIMGGHFDRVYLAIGDGPYRPLSPLASQKLYNHSPDGFAWGYGGSGPSQLALAILLKATGDKDYSLQHYQDFKWRVVGKLPFGKDFEITAELPTVQSGGKES